MMNQKAANQGWDYLDLWNLVPADQFTNSAIHVTPAGEALLSRARGTNHLTAELSMKTQKNLLLFIGARFTCCL